MYLWMNEMKNTAQFLQWQNFLQQTLFSLHPVWTKESFQLFGFRHPVIMGSNSLPSQAPKWERKNESGITTVFLCSVCGRRKWWQKSNNKLDASGKDSFLQKTPLQFNPEGDSHLHCFYFNTGEFILQLGHNCVHNCVIYNLSCFDNCSYNNQKDRKNLPFPSVQLVRVKYHRAPTEEHS